MVSSPTGQRSELWQQAALSRDKSKQMVADDLSAFFDFRANTPSMQALRTHYGFSTSQLTSSAAMAAMAATAVMSGVSRAVSIGINSRTLDTHFANWQTDQGPNQAEAFTVTNVQRATRGRVPLRHQACVQKWAVRQARKMARQERMFHQDLARVAKDCRLSIAGENVAYGYSTGRSVVVDGWMKSAGHRANILKRDYRLMGIGARRADGTWYVAQVFGRKAR